MQLYASDPHRAPSYNELADELDAATSFQQRIISPIMNGNMLGKFTVGSTTTGSTEGITIDGTNVYILMNDGTTNRLLLGKVPGT